MTQNAQAFRLGVLMLDTRFPRFPGEIGHPQTFPFAVDTERIAQAKVGRVVVDQELPEELVETFCEGAQRLRQRGAGLIATSCGFLAPLQSRLAAVSGCPVITSSLVLLPLLRALYGPQAPVAVLTFDAQRLGTRHLPRNVEPLLIGGLDRDAALYRAIAEDRPELDRGDAEAETLSAAHRLCQGAARPAALLLECTNLSPYKPALRAALGLAVYDIVDAVLWQARAAGWEDKPSSL